GCCNDLMFLLIGTPPKTTKFLRPRCLFKSAKVLSICIASSRVGAKIKAFGALELDLWPAHFCRIGMLKAAVFPVPVCAHPMMSFPFKINGIACDCISVGVL